MNNNRLQHQSGMTLVGWLLVLMQVVIDLAISIKRHVFLALAGWNLESDQINDLRELMRLDDLLSDQLEEEHRSYWMSRRIEQYGACRINGISVRRLNLIS